MEMRWNACETDPLMKKRKNEQKYVITNEKT